MKFLTNFDLTYTINIDDCESSPPTYNIKSFAKEVHHQYYPSQTYNKGL